MLYLYYTKSFEYIPVGFDLKNIFDEVTSGDIIYGELARIYINTRLCGMVPKIDSRYCLYTKIKIASETIVMIDISDFAYCTEYYPKFMKTVLKRHNEYNQKYSNQLIFKQIYNLECTDKIVIRDKNIIINLPPNIYGDMVLSSDSNVIICNPKSIELWKNVVDNPIIIKSVHKKVSYQYSQLQNRNIIITYNSLLTGSLKLLASEVILDESTIEQCYRNRNLSDKATLPLFTTSNIIIDDINQLFSFPNRMALPFLIYCTVKYKSLMINIDKLKPQHIKYLKKLHNINGITHDVLSLCQQSSLSTLQKLNDINAVIKLSDEEKLVLKEFEIKSKYQTMNQLKLIHDIDCPICYNNITTRNNIQTKCNHNFCIHCIDEMFCNFNEIKCPLCRESLIKKDIYFIKSPITLPSIDDYLSQFKNYDVLYTNSNLEQLSRIIGNETIIIIINNSCELSLDVYDKLHSKNKIFHTIQLLT